MRDLSQLDTFEDVCEALRRDCGPDRVEWCTMSGGSLPGAVRADVVGCDEWCCPLTALAFCRLGARFETSDWPDAADALGIPPDVAARVAASADYPAGHACDYLAMDLDTGEDERGFLVEPVDRQALLAAVGLE